MFDMNPMKKYTEAVTHVTLFSSLVQVVLTPVQQLNQYRALYAFWRNLVILFSNEKFHASLNVFCLVVSTHVKQRN